MKVARYKNLIVGVENDVAELTKFRIEYCNDAIKGSIVQTMNWLPNDVSNDFAM